MTNPSLDMSTISVQCLFEDEGFLNVLNQYLFIASVSLSPNKIVCNFPSFYMMNNSIYNVYLSLVINKTIQQPSRNKITIYPSHTVTNVSLITCN